MQILKLSQVRLVLEKMTHSTPHKSALISVSAPDLPTLISAVSHTKFTLECYVKTKS